MSALPTLTTEQVIRMSAGAEYMGAGMAANLGTQAVDEGRNSREPERAWESSPQTLNMALTARFLRAQRTLRTLRTQRTQRTLRTHHDSGDGGI